MRIIWSEQQWNCYFGYLTSVNLAGGILFPSWWEFCHLFSWVWIFNPKWIHRTHIGQTLVQIARPSAMTVNLSWCPRPLSEAYTFCKFFIPIRMLKPCSLEAAQCQQTPEKPNSSWQQGRWEGPGASSGPQQSKIHNLFQDSMAVSILRK